MIANISLLRYTAAADQAFASPGLASACRQRKRTMIYLSPPSPFIPNQRCILCNRPPRHGLGHDVIADIHAGGGLDGLVVCLRCGVSQLRDPRYVEKVMQQQLQEIDRDIARRRAMLSESELDDLQVERANCFLLMAQTWEFLGLDLGLWSDQRARSPWGEEQISYARRFLRRADAARRDVGSGAGVRS
jgi:hypothetical protein